jgi:hypothetical protein
VTVLIEEAARAQVPTLVIDVKGDLPNLLLTFPDFKESSFVPWVEREREEEAAEQVQAKARDLAQRQVLAGIRNRGYSVKFTGENRA